MFTTVAKHIPVSFSAITLTGDIQYDPEQHALLLADESSPAEVISTNLGVYGLEPREDTVFIRDWSEHTGLTTSLVAAGVVDVVRAINVGPFRSRAYEVRVLSAVAQRMLAEAFA